MCTQSSVSQNILIKNTPEWAHWSTESTLIFNTAHTLNPLKYKMFCYPFFTMQCSICYSNVRTHPHLKSSAGYIILSFQINPKWLYKTQAAMWYSKSDSWCVSQPRYAFQAWLRLGKYQSFQRCPRGHTSLECRENIRKTRPSAEVITTSHCPLIFAWNISSWLSHLEWSKQAGDKYNTGHVQ